LVRSFKAPGGLPALRFCGSRSADNGDAAAPLTGEQIVLDGHLTARLVVGLVERVV
jgi:hypothetical protein